MQNKFISALILSSGDDLLQMFHHTFAGSGIEPDVQWTATGAREALRQKQYDLLFMDADEPDATQLLDEWNGRDPNASKIAIVVSADLELLRQAQIKQARMVLQKPLRKALVEKTLKFAAELVMQKWRASYRHSVSIKCRGIAQDSQVKWKVDDIALLDLSRTGLCMRALPCIAPKTAIDLIFTLPETREMVQVHGKVIWTQPNGVAGVHFVPASQQDRKRLNSWFDARDPFREKVSLVENKSQAYESYSALSRNAY
jgi:CheY-like chemotaxis protein